MSFFGRNSARRCAQRRRRLPWGALLALLLVGAACDGRVRAIRAGLDDADRLRFDRGQQLSAACWSCHDFYGRQNKIGPYLSGIFGRRAGGADYGGYSEAMKRSQIVWTEATLARFLADVQGVVPGTTMVASGLPSSSDVGALVFYMKQVTQPPPDE